MSPGSPTKAMRVFLLSLRVLSSLTLRIEAPRMAALEATMMVQSLQVMPRRTSLVLWLVCVWGW